MRDWKLAYLNEIGHPVSYLSLVTVTASVTKMSIEVVFNVQFGYTMDLFRLSFLTEHLKSSHSCTVMLWCQTITKESLNAYLHTNNILAWDSNPSRFPSPL